MKEYILKDENRVIRQYFGAEVALDFDNNCRLEFDYCPATNLLYIRSKSYYSSKLSHFEDIDSLKKHLTMPPAVKSRRSNNKRQNVPQTAQEAADKGERDATLQTVQSADNPFNFDPADCDEVIVFDEDGNVTERSRSVEGIRRTYNAIRKKVESTVKVGNAFFVTPTLDTYPTFNEMSETVSDYARHIKRKYSNFKAGFIFLEPCEDGSWHAHLILYFDENQLMNFEDFEGEVEKWWRKRNTKPSDFQVTVWQITDKEMLLHALEYLDPFFVKVDGLDELEHTLDNLNPHKISKRARLHYYPLWCKPMRCFGEVVDSIRGTAPKEVIDRLDLEEYDAERRKRTEIYDTQLGEMIALNEEAVFVVNGLADVQTDDTSATSDSDNAEDAITTAGSAPREDKGWARYNTKKATSDSGADCRAANSKMDEFILHFLEKYTIPREQKDHGLETSQAQVYGMYKRECEDNGEPKCSKTEFDEFLRARGIGSVVLKYERIGYSIEATRAAREHFQNRSWH